MSDFTFEKDRPGRTTYIYDSEGNRREKGTNPLDDGYAVRSTNPVPCFKFDPPDSVSVEEFEDMVGEKPVEGDLHGIFRVDGTLFEIEVTEIEDGEVHLEWFDSLDLEEE